MTMQTQIKPGMPVKCADGMDHGQVDSVDGEYLKFSGGDSAQPHWLPLSAVDHADGHVHLNLTHDQIHQQWLSEDPHPEHRQ